MDEEHTDDRERPGHEKSGLSTVAVRYWADRLNWLAVVEDLADYGPQVLATVGAHMQALRATETEWTGSAGTTQ